MELSSRAFFAQELYPLWRYLEHRFELIGRQALKPDEPMARSGRSAEDRMNDPPVVARRANGAFARRGGSRRSAEHGSARQRSGSNDEITIAALALDAFNARVYHDMLEVRGYSAMTAPDVDSWLAVLGECDPDLILLDLCSSSHPSIDVARTIMRDPRYRSVPVITVTDAHKSGDLNDPARIIVDCDGRIFKPISVEGFYRPIEAILKHPDGRRTLGR